MDTKYDHEYLIKYKGVSYHHVQWVSALDIDAGNVSAKQMLSRYLTKIDKGDPTAQEDGDIDPTFMEIERILDVREEDVMEVQDETKAKASEAGETAKEKDVAASSANGVEAPTTATTAGSTSAVIKSEGAATVPSLPSRASFADSMSSKATKDDTRSVASDVSADSDVALTKMQIFSHVERCRRVLEKVWDDPLAVGFVEPVDTDLYEDYQTSSRNPCVCKRCVSDSTKAAIAKVVNIATSCKTCV